MRATSQPIKTTNCYEAVEPTDVVRDMLCRSRHRGNPQNNSLIVEKEQISGIWFF